MLQSLAHAPEKSSAQPLEGPGRSMSLKLPNHWPLTAENPFSSFSTHQKASSSKKPSAWFGWCPSGHLVAASNLVALSPSSANVQWDTESVFVFDFSGPWQHFRLNLMVSNPICQFLVYFAHGIGILFLCWDVIFYPEHPLQGRILQESSDILELLSRSFQISNLPSLKQFEIWEICTSGFAYSVQASVKPTSLWAPSVRKSGSCLKVLVFCLSEMKKTGQSKPLEIYIVFVWETEP